MVDFMESTLTHPPRKTDQVSSLTRSRLIGGEEDHSPAGPGPYDILGTSRREEFTQIYRYHR